MNSRIQRDQSACVVTGRFIHTTVEPLPSGYRWPRKRRRQPRRDPMDLRNRPPKHRRRANAGELRLSTAHPSASWSVVLPKNRRQLRAPISLPLDETRRQGGQLEAALGGILMQRTSLQGNLSSLRTSCGTIAGWRSCWRHGLVHPPSRICKAVAQQAYTGIALGVGLGSAIRQRPPGAACP